MSRPWIPPNKRPNFRSQHRETFEEYENKLNQQDARNSGGNNYNRGRGRGRFPPPRQQPRFNRYNKYENQIKKIPLNEDEKKQESANDENDENNDLYKLHLEKQISDLMAKLNAINQYEVCRVEKNPFAEGELRYAYKGTWQTPKKKGRPCVVKKFKERHIFNKSFWDADIKLHEKASILISEWNKLNIVNKKYKICIPIRCICATKHTISLVQNNEIATDEIVLVEDYLGEKFNKWNSNTGWIGDTESSVQAFCHWTYHYSKGELVMCDAQGARSNDGYYITDPCIVSKIAGTYGLTDCGEEYMLQFMLRHECNEYCDDNWLKPSMVQCKAIDDKFQSVKPTTYIFNMDTIVRKTVRLDLQNAEPAD